MSLDRNKLILMDLTGVGKYSYSKLSTYHTCQHQYNEHYNKGKRGRKNSFSSYGTMAHAILEDYFNEKRELDTLKDAYIEQFSAECGDGISMFIPTKDGDYFEKDLTDLYYNGGLDFFDEFDGFQDMTILGVEERFNMILDHKDTRFMFNGVIDLVAEKDDELYVIDHKSKGKFKSIKEKEEYRRQLALYSIFAEYKWARPVKEAWFNQFRIGHIERFEMTDEIIDEALDWAVDTIYNIETETLWLPNTEDRFYCKNLCDLRDQCPYFIEGDSDE